MAHTVDPGKTNGSIRALESAIRDWRSTLPFEASLAVRQPRLVSTTGDVLFMELLVVVPDDQFAAARSSATRFEEDCALKACGVLPVVTVRRRRAAEASLDSSWKPMNEE